jgi:hypothetical protein
MESAIKGGIGVEIGNPEPWRPPQSVGLGPVYKALRTGSFGQFLSSLVVSSFQFPVSSSPEQFP